MFFNRVSIYYVIKYSFRTIRANKIKPHCLRWRFFSRIFRCSISVCGRFRLTSYPCILSVTAVLLPPSVKETLGEGALRTVAPNLIHPDFTVKPGVGVKRRYLLSAGEAQLYADDFGVDKIPAVVTDRAEYAVVVYLYATILGCCPSR